MPKEAQLRNLSERVMQATLATLPRRPLPVSAHQAAEELYNAVDRYMDAVNANQLAAARQAAERLAVEALRVMIGYEMPQVPNNVERVKVENAPGVAKPTATRR